MDPGLEVGQSNVIQPDTHFFRWIRACDSTILTMMKRIFVVLALAVGVSARQASAFSPGSAVKGVLSKAGIQRTPVASK